MKEHLHLGGHSRADALDKTTAQHIRETEDAVVQSGLIRYLLIISWFCAIMKFSGLFLYISELILVSFQNSSKFVTIFYSSISFEASKAISVNLSFKVMNPLSQI